MNEQYFYPLYKEFDKNFFEQLKIAIEKQVQFKGSETDKQKFMKDLLMLQLIRDYRKHLKIIYKFLDQPYIEIPQINELTKANDFAFNTKWVIFKVEKDIISMAKRLKNQDIQIDGSNRQFDEFVLRYLATIWLVDWTGPIYAILKLLNNKKYIFDPREANRLLVNWDFTNIFNN